MRTVDYYEIFFESSRVGIEILEDENTLELKYNMLITNVSKYTNILVNRIKEDILREGLFDNLEDNYSYDKLKEAFVKKVNLLINFYLPNYDSINKNKLLSYIVRKSLDLGFIDILICDDKIEEIAINGTQTNVKIYHKIYGWLETNLSFNSEDEIKEISSKIAVLNKKNFSKLNPLLDAHLRGGHRVNAILDGISTSGNSITIRRFTDKPWNICDLLKNKTSQKEIFAFIWQAIENELSIIVSGGTGSGKTSFLNAITSFIVKDQRIISIEDTREISLSKYSHWVPMESRKQNQEGKGEVTILDLIINALRMRPDRIIIGEIRRKKEVEVLFEAMRTGHSVYGTFHANTANETILRLTSPPIEIPRFTLSSIGLIVVLNRDKMSGQRNLIQLAEVNEKGEENIIFRYNKKQQKYILENEPINLYKKINDISGTLKEEIQKEIKEKIRIIDYIEKNNIDNIEDISNLIFKFYKQKKKRDNILN